MLCVCAQKLQQAGKLMAAVNEAATMNAAAALNVAADLPRLNLTVAAALDLDALPRLPGLIAALPGMAIAAGAPSAAPLQAAGLAVAQMRAAFGIPLLDAQAQAQLNALAKGLNPAAVAGLPAPSADLLNVAVALSAVVNAKLALKLDLLGDAQAAAKLSEKLAPLAAAPPALAAGSPVALALGKLVNLALVFQAAKLQFGIDLAAPGGPVKLAAALQALVSLKPPALSVPLPKLNLLLAAVQVSALAKEALGVNLSTAAGASKLAAALSVLAALKLPTLPVLPALNLGGLKLALAMPAAQLKVDLSALNATLGRLPNFSGLAALASLAMAVKANLGIDLVASAPCSAICPAA